MLRILKNGKAISLKEQDKLVNAKGSRENVNPPVNFDRPAKKAAPKYPGLKKAVKKVTDAKAKR